MNKNKLPIKPELRATDVEPSLYRAVVDSARKNERSISSEIIYQLKQVYKIK